MNRRKFLLGSSATLASAGFLTGTGAFSSAEAERNVKIAIVRDEDAYLGLSEDDNANSEILFGEPGPNETSETFTITNQSASKVTITVELTERNLRFHSPTSADRYELRETLDPGESIESVEIGISSVSGLPEIESVRDTISFEAEGEGLHIQADRTLELKPLDAHIQQGSVKSAIQIRGVSDVDNSTVWVYTDSGKFPVEEIDTQGNNLRIEFDDPERLGCDSSSDQIEVTVTGRREDGLIFMGSTFVNCAAVGEDKQDDENEDESEDNASHENEDESEDNESNRSDE